MFPLSKIIKTSFLALFFFTPLLFTSSNSELFELPKMYFVYALTVIIFSLHFFNYLKGNVPLFRRHFLQLPLILFFVSQLVATILSVDPHTSLFGYYSRLNGGLLSLISYLLLFEILIVYIEAQFRSQIIYSVLASGFFVAAFGILEHFGIDKHLWLQDVQSRVFSTLGQPNWLAAYLCILLPLSLYMFLTSGKLIYKTLFAFLFSSYYLCLLFTKSKSGIVAALLSLILLLVALFIKRTSFHLNQKIFSIIIPLLIIFSLLINNPIQDYSLTLLENIGIIPKSAPATPVRTDINITPSEDIRKIVWTGSLDLWKKFPLFGTGVETFAYSYYWTRPQTHNLTSEWDFLYNKAHNEYLNYLATTGAFGFITYTFLILTILSSFLKSKNFLLSLALASSFITILITNIAGFSVVIVSLFFFLLPALAFDELKFTPSPSFSWPKKLSALVLLGFSLTLIGKIFLFYLADILYADAQKFDNRQDYSKAYETIQLSLGYNSSEPIYLSFLSSQAAKLAVTTDKSDSAKRTSYINSAINASNAAVSISPANINILKERAQMYYYLSTLDTKYFQESIDTLFKITQLAPTDAKTFYLIGRFLEAANNKTDALEYYQKAINLKSNYDYAYYAAGVILFDQKKYPEAKTNFENVLKYAPTNQDAKDYLDKIKVHR